MKFNIKDKYVMLFSILMSFVNIAMGKAVLFLWA
jgi:hypothetical protein